jgi:hypothetical protein
MHLTEWNSRLQQHFEDLRRQRLAAAGDKPLFVLEHGLSTRELQELTTEIRSHIVVSPPDDGHGLPWIVYAAEVGRMGGRTRGRSARDGQARKGQPRLRRHRIEILELAKSAHNLFIRQDPNEQARLLKTLVSKCNFDRGSLSVAYVKPFDLRVDGNESGNWLGRRDSFPFATRRSRVAM